MRAYALPCGVQSFSKLEQLMSTFRHIIISQLQVWYKVQYYRPLTMCLVQLLQNFHRYWLFCYYLTKIIIACQQGFIRDHSSSAWTALKLRESHQLLKVLT